ncbi:DUF4388 domain-containing protein [Enhygromyxa salina]|uniref:DUF4388 domain-containing protein n=1 Tax=Enhygromyxa salina TaxID=215803 RepID=UPI0015E5A148|nr:DUF4388 domain-containing protein [Enhygromyxa salina]
MHIVQFGEGESASPLDLAMVVESPGPELGELSKRVRAQHPELSLVVIAPRFDERGIDVAAGVEATAIIPSPCESGTLLRVLKAQERKVSFAGRCEGVETSELLRLHAIAGSNGILHLAAEGRSGAIHLEDGQPIHAHCEGHLGVDAVRELLRWRGGKATWIAGRSAAARTIVGRIQGLLEHDLGESRGALDIEQAPRDVLEKIERLAQTTDILAAYLLRNTEVIAGRNDSSLDDAVVGRVLTRLSQVFHDMEVQQGDGAGTEIQATVGEHRLVVDRLGPSRLGFQVGVVVRQATPVCKSLRRLLRQIDRSFRRSLASAARNQASADAGSGQAARSSEAAGLHRVA